GDTRLRDQGAGGRLLDAPRRRLQSTPPSTTPVDDSSRRLQSTTPVDDSSRRPPLPLIFVMTTQSWGNIAGGTGAPRRRLTSAVERVAPLLEKSASGEDEVTSRGCHPYRGALRGARTFFP